MTYAVVTLSITDAEALAQYREAAGAALAAHGAKAIGSSTSLVVLQGDPTLPDVIAILEFAGKASALAWINDPALAKVHELRARSGKCEIVLLG